MKHQIITITILLTSLDPTLTSEASEQIGDYKIQKLNISKTCSSFTREDLHYPYSKILSGMESSKKYFKFGRDNAERFYEDKNLDHLTDTAKQAAFLATPLWICLLITLILAPCVTIFFFCKACKCCFRSCCGNIEDENLKNGDKEEDVKRKKENVRKRERVDTTLNSPRCKKIVYYCNICLVTLLIIFSVFWAVFGFRAISGMKKADCSTSYFYNDVEEGVNRENSKWIGIRGYETLMVGLKNEILNLKETNIFEENLGVKAGSLENLIKVFYTNFRDKTVQDFRNKTEVFKPDIVKNLTEGVNSEIKKDTETLVNSSLNIVNFDSVASDITLQKSQLESGKIKKSPYIQIIDSHLSKINSYYYGMSKVRILAKMSLDYDNRSPILRFYVWGNLIILTIGLVLFVVASTYSHKLKRHMRKAVTCQAITSVYILLTALSWNSIAIISMVIGSISINVCGYTDRLLDNPVYSKKLISSTLIPFLEACVFEGSHGDISKNLGESIYVEKLNSVFKGLSVDFDEIDLGDLEEPKSYKDFLSKIEKILNYEENDFEEYGTSFQEVATNITSVLSCVQNEVRVKPGDCVYSEISKLSDDLQYKNNEKYCIVPSLFNFPSIKDRYQNSCTSAAIEPFEILKNSVDQHQKLLKEMHLNFNSCTDFSKKVKKSLKNVKSEFENLKLKLPKTSKFFEKKGERYKDILDCRVIRQIAQDGLGNYCYEFVLNWIRQAIFIIILAPIMTIFGICSFFSVMQVDLKHKRFQKHGNYSRAIVMPMNQSNENGKILGSKNDNKEKKVSKGHVENFGDDDGFNFDFGQIHSDKKNDQKLPEIRGNFRKKNNGKMEIFEDDEEGKSKKTMGKFMKSKKKSKEKLILNKKKKEKKEKRKGGTMKLYIKD